MTNQKESRPDKWTELFSLLELSVEEQKAAEAYLDGKEGIQVLEGISFRDISGTDPEPVKKMFDELIRKKGKAGLQPVKGDMGRLFQVLFARGRTTCHEMVPTEIFRILRPTEWADPVRMTATHGVSIGALSYLHSYWIESVLELAGNDPEVIKQAITLVEDTFEKGRFILFAYYFYAKYQKKCQLPIEREDAQFLSAYEELAVKFFEELYFASADQTLFRELSEALSGDGIPERFMPIIGLKRSFSQTLLRVVAGLSYINYNLSKKLKNIVRLCLLANLQEGLDAVYIMSQGTYMDIGVKGGSYDKIFGIDSEEYLTWAVMGDHKNIMRKQLKENTECYLRVMSAAGAAQSTRMLCLVKEQNPELFEKIVEEQWSGNNEEREKLIEVLSKADPNLLTARAWLRGEITFEKFCEDYDRDKLKSFYGGYYEWELLATYFDNFKDKEFFRRVEVYMFFRGMSTFFVWRIRKYGKWSVGNLETALVKEMFAELNMEGLGYSMQLSLAGMIYDDLYEEEEQKKFLGYIKKYFSGLLKESREEMLSVFAGADVFGRCIGLKVLSKDAEVNKEEILKYSQDGSKAVRQQVYKILCSKEGWEDEVKEFLSSKKAAQRELAIRVLSEWQKSGADYGEVFARAMEKEKNVKIRELLGNALGIKDDGKDSSGRDALSREELVKLLHKGGKKRSLSWAYEVPFSAVHMASGDVLLPGQAKGKEVVAADEEYLQAILLCYCGADGCGVNKNAAYLAKYLNAAEFAVYVNGLFDRWMDAGAEAKKRWVLYAAAIHGGSDIIEKLYRQIKEWPQKGRGAIACEAVKALSLSPLPQALLIVDGIARKFKFKQVRAAAGEALSFAASQLGITREELADRIVPDLGFDGNMERLFDYGERKFVVTITTALEIEIFEGVEADKSPHNLTRGKKLKNLPAPGKRDDEVKAAAAYGEFKQMKKQMKTTVASQKQRLELALSTAREWEVEAWKLLFVKNPIMHQFAIGLIWGMYEEGRLTKSFRYMEDGSFNTEEGDEFFLPAQGKIGLVHPVELDGQSKIAWKEQLADYEIVQPFEQLDRAVFAMTEEEAGTQELTRFQDKTVNDMVLGSRLFVLGWYRGSVQDAGGFDTYYREDKEIGLGVELHFSGSFVGYSNEDVTVYDARFYKAGTIARGSYVYDEADKDKALFLREVPARYFSEIVWQLGKAIV